MKKDLFVAFVILFVLILIFSGVEIQSVDEYYLTHLDDIREDSETVFLTVRCDEALEHVGQMNVELLASGLLPSDGVILARTEYVLREGDSVYEILDRAMRHNRIPTEYVYSSDGGVYVKGMGHLYEYDCGPLSGWSFSVNGEPAQSSCNRLELSDGDEIVWSYTCSLGLFSAQEGGGGQ